MGALAEALIVIAPGTPGSNELPTRTTHVTVA